MRALVAGLITLLPLGAWAQTTAPLGPGGAPAAREQAKAEGPVRWTLGLSAEERWEDNPGFVTSGESSFVSSAGLDFSRTWRSPRGELSLRGNGDATAYYSIPDLSRFSYGGVLDGKYQLSPRFSIEGEQRYSLSNALEAVDLHEAGLLLPQVRTVTLTSLASFTASLSSATTLTGEARYDRFEFDSDDLVDSQALVGAGTLTHRLGEHSSAGLSYSFVDNGSGGDSSQVHVLRSEWSTKMGSHWELQASGGVSKLTPAGGGDAVWDPAGGIGLTARYPHSEVSLRYSHTISQAFGLGQERVLDFVSASLSRRVSQRVTVRADGSYGLSRDPLGDSFHIHTVSANGSLRVTLARELGLTLGGRLDRSSEPVGDAVAGGPPVSTATALVGLVWDRAWQ